MRMRVHVCVHVRVYVFMCMSVYARACVSVRPSVRPPAWLWHVCVCVCACVGVGMRMRMRMAYMLLHIHVYIGPLLSVCSMLPPRLYGVVYQVLVDMHIDYVAKVFHPPLLCHGCARAHFSRVV